MLALLPLTLHAQDSGGKPPRGITQPLSAGKVLTTDTLKNASIPDSTALKLGSDTVKLGQKGDIDTEVVYSARDSIIFDVALRTMFLYGTAKINYGTIELQSGEVSVGLSENMLKAYPSIDSLGKKSQRPVFKDGDESFNADTIFYNFKSRKGLVKKAVTQQDDGFVRSETSKRLSDGIVYNANAIYTTCNLDAPHFAIHARKLKMAPKKYVVSGPFNLEINQIPTPLGFFFGYFPMPEKRTSGIIVPKYGESRTRGYYLRDGGFYWAINEYMDMKVLGQIYTRGGWGASLDYQYKKRYAFGGGFNFSYNKIVQEGADFQKQITNDFWVRWSHTPVSKGSSRFSASVNAGTSTFNRNNTFNVQDYLSASFNSNISYGKTFVGTPFTANINLRHNQNVQTKETTVFPEANVTMNRIYPFKKLVKKPKSALAQLNMSYSFNSKLNISNKGLGQRFNFKAVQDSDVKPDSVYAFNFGNLSFLMQEAKYGAVHSIPISTSLTLFKFFQLSPTIRYDEYWYPRKLSYAWDDARDSVVVSAQEGFFRAYSYSGDISMNTSFYAFYYFKGKKIKAIRQQITPSMSAGYKPDFTDPRYGFYQELHTDTTQSLHRISRFEGSIFGSPQGGKSQSLMMNLETLFEMKVANSKDTTGVNKEKKITLLRMSTSYNALLDSFNLSDIRFTTNANIANGKVSLTFSGALDPYAYQKVFTKNDTEFTSRRIADYAIERKQGLARVSNMSMGFSTRLSPNGVQPGGNALAKSTAAGQSVQQQQLADIAANPDRYVDFSIPWNINLRYNLNYNKKGFDKANITQTFDFSGDLSLTEKWKLNFSSGYDLQRKAVTFTNIGIMRDLHCWQMQIGWTPFGARQSYNIDIRVKSSLLQDLKISKRNIWYDR